MPLSRRSLLQSAALGLPTFAGLKQLRLSAAEEAPRPGLITRQSAPDNLEFPFATLQDWKTPNSQFFVRSHFHVPEIKADDWSLRVEGHVERPFTVGLNELQQMDQATHTVLLECAGNGRVFLQPLQPGLRWEQGGVSNADWTGTPVGALLERARVKSGAVEVIFEGDDRKALGQPGPPGGEVPFSRSVSLQKAMDAHTLLAWQMNGEDLPPAHGYPVRAVIPGWYGMASIKWLRRIVVTDRPFDGYFQTFNYTTWTRPDHGLPSLTPVTEMDVKSQIARPMSHETIAAGKAYRIFGAAWAGEPEISKVEISVDGGKTWSPAALDQKSQPYAWRFFQFDWSSPARGDQTLMCRATDTRGRTQPMDRDADRRDAMITHVQPIAVHVR
jgi:DMSO/TMAO reductase YedYZ molybdopterin-dependent catalytic subunit